MSSTPVDGADLLGRIQPKLREEAVEIVLAPALVDEWQAAEDAVVESKRADSANARLSSGKASAKTLKLVEELETIEKRLAEAAVMFRFRALDKDAYRALTAKHPPRDGDQIDRYMGYNREAVEDQMIHDCLYDPVFTDCTKKGCKHDDCGSWDQLVKVINPSEWEELRSTVQLANRAVTEVPKSLMPSAIRRLSSKRSPSQSASE